MLENTVPKTDTRDNPTGCCPRFNPVGWENQYLKFRDKLFVRAETTSALHVPLNMGHVFTRVQEHIEESGAYDPETSIVLSHDLSPWKAEHYFSVTKDVDGEKMTTLSGDFFTRVFEGPYSEAKDWVHEMEVAVTVQGKKPKRVFMYYTTCPRCAKVYAKNYVIGVAEI